MNNSSHSANGKAKYSVLFGCSLMLTIAYMSLSSWSIAIPSLSKHFNLSGAMIQIGSAALLAGYAVGNFVEGKALSVFGLKRTFLCAMAMFLVGSILIPFVNDYRIIIFLRFIMGFGLIMNITCTAVGVSFPIDQRGLAIGILMGCIGLGSAIGAYLSAILLPILGWKNTFLVLSAITIIGIIVFCITVKTPSEILKNSTVKDSRKEKTQNSIYTSPLFITYTIATFWAFFNIYGMYSFIGYYFLKLGYTAQQTGFIVFVNGITAIVSTPVGGWISDKFVAKGVSPLTARAKTMAYVGGVVGFVGCLLVPFAAQRNMIFVIVAVIIAGWGSPATNSPCMSLPVDLFGSKKAASVNGTMLMLSATGAVIAPIFVLYLAEHYSLVSAWIMLAISCVLLSLCCLALPKSKR